MKVNIDEEIVKKIKERLKNTDEFTEIEAYINFVLKELLTEGSHKKEEKEIIEKRLKELGYV